MSSLIAPSAPSLLLAPLEYDHRFQEQFSSQLRLYFNQVDNANARTIINANSAATLWWLGGSR